MPSADFDLRTLGRANALIVLAVALAVVIALVGYRATLGEHEVYAAEPAREMLAGGNPLLQPFAGAFRTKKPPGQSWLIAASMFVTQSRSEFSARLPSALAATATALLLAHIATAISGRRVGLVAGLMTLTCYGVQVRARLAEADMALTALVALAMATLLVPIARREPTRALHGIAFWLAVAFGFLVKGPIVLGFTLLPATLFAVLERRHPAAKSKTAAVLLNPVGVAIGVLLIVGWPVAAVMTYPPAWEQWMHELFDRAAGEIRDNTGALRRDPIFAYLGFIPLAALPWTIFAIVPLLSKRFRRRAVRSPAGLLLTLWAACGAFVVTLIAFKRMHYALPMLGPVIVLSAIGFDRLAMRFAARRPIGSRERWIAATIAAWVALAGAAWVANQLFVEPNRDPADRATRAFASIVNATSNGAPVYLVGVGEDRTVWYLDRVPIQTRFRDDETIEAQVDRLPAGNALVFCRAVQVDDLAALGRVETVAVSDSYREKAGDEKRTESERRTLVRFAKGPATQPAG